MRQAVLNRFEGEEPLGQEGQDLYYFMRGGNTFALMDGETLQQKARKNSQL